MCFFFNKTELLYEYVVGTSYTSMVNNILGFASGVPGLNHEGVGFFHHRGQLRPREAIKSSCFNVSNDQ